jgi:hypothetical protein
VHESVISLVYDLLEAVALFLGEADEGVSRLSRPRVPRRGDQAETRRERLLPNLLPNSVARGGTSRDKERFRIAES